jgi:glycosyltransferase involved in cell wall biosynthesis
MNSLTAVGTIEAPCGTGTGLPRIILDITRTIGQALNPVPTGIDRVELAYISGLMALAPERLVCAVVLPFTWRLIPARRALPLVDAIAACWHGGRARRAQPWAELLHLLSRSVHAVPRWLRPRPGRGSVYMNVSHLWLDRPGALRALLHHERARMLCLIHDTIPIDMPEYVRPGEAATHRRRMQTVGALADAIVTNSDSTTESLRRFVRHRDGGPLITAAPLGVDPPAGQGLPPLRLQHRAYFVTVGTIEPRKNHLLLLHLWRRFAETLGAAAPKLLIIGRRGWENENVIDLIERSAGSAMLIEEHNDLPDREVSALLRGARALLFPSFAEGYGLPLAEALALGTPAIASDLPSLRGVGGDGPEYLDPLDALAWSRAILDYAAPDSPRRAAQLARLPAWPRPLWRDHVATALAAADALSDGTYPSSPKPQGSPWTR